MPASDNSRWTPSSHRGRAFQEPTAVRAGAAKPPDAGLLCLQRVCTIKIGWLPWVRDQHERRPRTLAANSQQTKTEIRGIILYIEPTRKKNRERGSWREQSLTNTQYQLPGSQVAESPGSTQLRPAWPAARLHPGASPQGCRCKLGRPGDPWRCGRIGLGSVDESKECRPRIFQRRKRHMRQYPQRDVADAQAGQFVKQYEVVVE